MTQMDTPAAVVVELSGLRTGHVHPLGYGEHLVGRGSGVTIALEGGDVSRRHAKLDITPEGVKLEDLGSKNGVYVGGRRIVGTVMLRHGDRLEIGGLELELLHPPSQVTGALVRAGEATVTRMRGNGGSNRSDTGGLLVPLVTVALFAALVAASLLLG